MDKKEFAKLFESGLVLLDGATGTELQKRGMPSGVCPEVWASENPEIIKDVQREYGESGSKIIYTSTFGANRLKLSEYGQAHRTEELNKRLAELCREAVGVNCLVAGDLAPTGRFIEPLGDLGFEECVEVYKQQIRGLLAGGVDLFVIETMMDIQEARAALLAVKESCSLPVMVSMSYEKNMRTLMGTDPVTALITLQSLGADVVGCNCSAGPAQMLDIIAAMKPYARVPLLAKPNAGLPRLVEGRTEFDMGAEEFSLYAESFVEAGASLLGGCCGTSPEYIKKLTAKSNGLIPLKTVRNSYSALTSVRSTVFFGKNYPLTIVGERINPTGKKKLQEELRQGQTDQVNDYAIEQIECGAKILDVNVGMSGIDEKQMMAEIVTMLSSSYATPLCIDSSSPEVIESALRLYPGRAMINSISAEKGKMDKLLQIASKYGAMFILLPLSEAGVPSLAVDRQKLISEVFEAASAYGYDKDDIVADGLVMTVSADQTAAQETLKLIGWCTEDFGCATVVGLSNVSFGLPERLWINSAFLAMAAARGLTLAIANPSTETTMNLKFASDVLTLRDKNSENYIERFSGQSKENSGTHSGSITQNRDPGEMLFDAVLKGLRNEMPSLIDAALNSGISAATIVDNFLIPAINRVGDMFNEKKYYLPQLIQSAEAMKAGFEKVQGMLSGIAYKADGEADIVLATVKGDIHDIGKNIVGLMLKNYGFTVLDLGKDVTAEHIVSEAVRTKASIIGLSALMTTTMTGMSEVVKLAKEKLPDCRIMIGGAVVDEAYAKEIGADGYSKDAYEAILLAKRLKNK